MKTIWDKKPEVYLAQFNRKTGHPSRGYVWNVIRRGGHKSMLECGIGNGDIPRFITKYGCPIQYTGLDCTEAFIEHAKKEFTAAQFQFTVGDMQDIPFEDDTFDLVYTRHTVEHLPHYRKAVKQMWRVAKERVIIVLFHPFKGKEKIKLDKKKGCYSNYYQEKPFRELLGKLFKSYKIYFTPQTSKFSMDYIIDCQK